MIDVRGWAHDFKSQNLRRLLAPEFELIIVPQKEVVQRDLDHADLVMVYYWRQIEILQRMGRRLPDSLLVGVCSHEELDGDESRSRGLDLIDRHAGAVFANNARLATQCAERFSVQTYYTPNGVDTTFFRPAQATRSPRRPRLRRSEDLDPTISRTRQLRVGWAGSLSNHGDNRGYPDVILPAIRRVDGIDLVTAAREDHWRGPSEMREFYQGVDLYVCASRAEGTPNPCLEASACGVGLVSTPVGNMPEFIEHGKNGVFVDRSVESLADALRELVAAPQRVEAMGAAARERAIEWDWSVHAENYRKMFRDALADRTTRIATE